MSIRICVLSSLLAVSIFTTYFSHEIEASSGYEPVVLRVVINTEEAGDFFLLLSTSGKDVLMKREDLRKTRLIDGVGTDVLIDEVAYVPLVSISGLSFVLKEQISSLEVTAEPALLKLQKLRAAYASDYKVEYPKANSAFLNYNLTTDFETSPNIYVEAGARNDEYLGVSTFSYIDDGLEGQKVVRLLTTVTTDKREDMRSFALGDVSASSGPLGVGSVLGGIGVYRNFSVNPYFIKYPSLDFEGTLLTPSELSIYVNGQLVRREDLLSGGFQLDSIPAEVGPGNVEVVLKDAFGRQWKLEKQYYYSDRLLKKGLHEYGYSLGFIRENLGTESFEYGGPAFLGFHNYGVSEDLKAGYMVGLSGKAANIGPSLSFLFFDKGVMDLSFSLGESDKGFGYAGHFGYFFLSKFLNAVLSLGYFSDGYVRAGAESGGESSNAFTSSLGLSNRWLGSLSVGVSGNQWQDNPDTTRYSIFYSRPIYKDMNTFVNLSRTVIEGEGDEESFFLGLTYSFGNDKSAGLTYESQNGLDAVKVEFAKSIPFGNGFGYSAEIEQSDDETGGHGSVQYQSGYGTYELDYQRDGGSDSLMFSTSGGMGYIDGSLFLSRKIYDGFAKVRVGGVEGVRVYYSGSEVGKTDRKGEIIIPSVRSYQDSKIGIENGDIPIEYSIASTLKYISTPDRGGALVVFDVKKTQGQTGRLYASLPGGKEVPIEFAVLIVEADGKFVEGMVGKAGEVYIENLPHGKFRGRTEYEGKECVFDIIVPDSGELYVELGDMKCEILD